MSEVSIRSETDVPQGWRYVVAVTDDAGATTEHRMRLGWVDHNHWSGERAIPPSQIAEAVVRYLLAVCEAPLPERFDAALARRWAPAIDRELGGYVGPVGRPESEP